MKLDKPVRAVQLDEPYDVEDTLTWLKEHNTLNIAGPRERTSFSIYELAHAYLTELFKAYD